MRPAVLAVDIGSSGARAIVYDARLAPRAAARRAHEFAAPAPGRAEQDPRRLARAAVAAIRQAARAARRRGYAVGALAPAAYLHGILAADARGRPLTPILSWADARAGAEARRLPPALGRRTGCPPHASFPIAKIAWWRANDAVAATEDLRFLSPKAWLLQRWTGHAVEDETTASASGLLNASSGRWDAAALSAAGVDARRLPEVAPATAIAGPVRAAFARTAGLPAGTPVLAGGGDGMLAALGSGAVEPGDISLTIGTTFAARRVVPRFLPDRAGRLWCYRFPEGRWIAGAASNNGAVLFVWLRDLLFPGLSWREAARRAAADPTPAPLFFYPHLLGERTPDWSNAPSAAFVGLRRSATAADLARAVAQGLCFQIRLLLETLERATGPSRRIVLSGGGFDAKTLPPLLAAVLGRPVTLSADPEATARGAAVLAFAALGRPVPPRIARRAGPIVHPRGALAARFERLYKTYRTGLGPMRALWSALEDGQ